MSLRIEQYNEGEAEHTQKLELDGLEEVQVNATLQLLDIFRVYGVTTTKVFSRALSKLVISSYDVYRR
jgi:hypothetical protein